MTNTDPLDLPLPCDITIGHITMHKGVKLRSLVSRMKMLVEMTQAAPTPPVREPLSDDQCRDIYNSAMELPNRSAVSVMRYIESKIKEQK